MAKRKSTESNPLSAADAAALQSAAGTPPTPPPPPPAPIPVAGRSAPKQGEFVAFYDSRYSRPDLHRTGLVVENLPNGLVHLKVFGRPSLDVAVFGTEHHVLNVEFKNIRGLQGLNPTGQLCTWLPD